MRGSITGNNKTRDNNPLPALYGSVRLFVTVFSQKRSYITLAELLSIHSIIVPMLSLSLLTNQNESMFFVRYYIHACVKKSLEVIESCVWCSLITQCCSHYWGVEAKYILSGGGHYANVAFFDFPTSHIRFYTAWQLDTYLKYKKAEHTMNTFCVCDLNDESEICFVIHFQHAGFWL